MDSKEPPPFGYTFEGDFFGHSPTAFTNGLPPLLNETENQSLLDFFSQDPFGTENPPFTANTDTKGGMDDFSWDFVPPPNVHQVSTTIPDQPQLTHGFHTDHFAPDPLPNTRLPTTHADLQAASTLFANAQVPHANARSYSMPTVPSMHGLSATTPNPASLSTSNFHTNVPLVPTPHGMMSEQLAALLPNHSEQGSIDAQVASQFSNAPQPELVERHRPNLKRSYTYGTDAAFNSSGYVAPNPHAEAEITYRLINDVFRAQPLLRQPPPGPDGEKPPSPTGHINLPASFVDIPSDEEQSGEEETSGEDDREAHSKKRRRTKTGSKSSMTRRKSSSGARSSKRKASADNQGTKKKRLSSAGQKAHRENLTEEQKRSNHIHSEQKRRNLINRGFEDLHDLVPEIRNGGLSKSGRLMEAAIFLENVIADNIRYMHLSGATDG